MYVLFAVLASLAVYVALVVLPRLTRRSPDLPAYLAPVSLLVLAAALVGFNLTSRAAGVDLGPGHAVSYNIPHDYLAEGALGTLALLVYAAACLSPALAFALLRRRQRAS